jgi:hypothetical protein
LPLVRIKKILSVEPWRDCSLGESLETPFLLRNRNTGILEKPKAFPLQEIGIMDTAIQWR